MSKRKGFKGKGLLLGDMVAAPGLSLQGLRPTSNEEVFYFVNVEILKSDEDLGEWFSFTIATPEALRARATETPSILVDRAFLIVSEFDWDTILAHLKKILDKCAAPTLHDSIPLLQRYFRWDYDDYSR